MNAEKKNIFYYNTVGAERTAEMMTDCRPTEGSVQTWHLPPSPSQQRLRDVIVGNLCFSLKELNRIRPEQTAGAPITKGKGKKGEEGEKWAALTVGSNSCKDEDNGAV